MEMCGDKRKQKQKKNKIIVEVDMPFGSIYVWFPSAFRTDDESEDLRAPEPYMKREHLDSPRSWEA